MKIILMRHGQPMLDLYAMKRIRLSPSGLGKIIDDYDAAVLNPCKPPPKEAIKIANRSKIAISSDLPRAVDSIQMLGIENMTVFDSSFRESRLPYVNWNKPRLSAFTWCLIFRTAWLCGFADNGESIRSAKQRAGSCVLKLIGLAQSHGSVLMMGHGILNRLVAKILNERGWANNGASGQHYWSYTVFRDL